MSIIVLTPKPPQAVAADSTASFGTRLADGFLHMCGFEGQHFASFEELRDYAQAQINATVLATNMAAAESVVVPEPVVTAEPVAAAVAPHIPGDASEAVNGSAG